MLEGNKSTHACIFTADWNVSKTVTLHPLNPDAQIIPTDTGPFYHF